MTDEGVQDLFKLMVTAWPEKGQWMKTDTIDAWRVMLSDFTDADVMTAFKRIRRDSERRPGMPSVDELERYSVHMKRERLQLDHQREFARIAEENRRANDAKIEAFTEALHESFASHAVMVDGECVAPLGPVSDEMKQKQGVVNLPPVLTRMGFEVGERVLLGGPAVVIIVGDQLCDCDPEGE